ncbi:heavy-metal-associated domain-containing protein [Chitinibacteraceae bacterium HSL-7]
METLHLQLSGLSCGGCIASVERVLAATAGIHGYKVALDHAEISYDASVVSTDAIAEAIEDAGYDVVR